MTTAFHVLVVDDLPDNRNLLVQWLRHAGYRVSEAADGAEALALIAAERPDMMLLDLQMPHVDGFEVLERLRPTEGAFLPVIVVTAASEREQRLRALELGAQEFLTKPVDTQELLARVKTISALKAAHDRHAAQAQALTRVNAELISRQTELEQLNIKLAQHAELTEQEVARRTEELLEANARLREADRYKDEFLSVISHELRTPLNFITGFASVLDDEVMGPLSDEQHACVQKILAGSDRMLMLVNDLLDFARIRGGDFRLVPASTPLRPLVEEVLVTMEPLAVQKGIAIAAEVAELAPVLDGQRLMQVLTNLLDNSIKFTPPGGSVHVRAAAEADHLVIEVEDTGCGIAPADFPRLFKRFQQLDMGKTRGAGGLGLGLAICKELVEAHQGTIEVESQLGEGALFRLRLPLRVSLPVEAPVASTSS